MAIDLYITPDPDHATVRADRYRRATNSEEGSAIHGFFAPSTVSLQHLMLFIRDQRNGKLVLVAKALLRAERVGGDAEDLGSGCRERRLQSREINRLPGAAGRIGAGIKEQHQFLADVVRKRDQAAAIARQMERRRLGAFGKTAVFF